MSVPLLSLGSSTVRSNPLPGTSSHCKINRSIWPNKTQISKKKSEAISNHAYKWSKNLKYLSWIKRDRSDHKIKVHRIPTDTPQKNYITWISKRPLYWEWGERERGSHLATNCGPVGLQRTTHAYSERHQWTWWIPPWWCLDWIWWFWTLWLLELIFVDSPRVFGILGYL